MLKNVVSLFAFLTTTILGLTSSMSFSFILVSGMSTGTSLRAQSGNSTDIISLLDTVRNVTSSSKSCDALTTCKDCTDTYTCHWCEHSESCHTRGSIHGCAWGNTCKDIKPPKKENNTCASQTTCSDCALASHFCHWCEYDNACHAVGSRFGCAIGVDCYSNDRCRRSEPEPFPIPSSPIQAAVAALKRVPVTSFIVIVFLFMASCGCLSCCFFFVSSIKGGYDELAEIVTSASVAPMSVIGEAHFTQLSEFPEEEAPPEEGNEPNNYCDTNNDNENNNLIEITDGGGGATVEQPSQTSQQCEEVSPATAEAQNNNNQQQQQPTEERSYPYFSTNNTRHNIINLHNQEHETGPLLHPSFNGTMGVEEPRHMKRLYRFCSALYYVSAVTLVLVAVASIFFYPQIPIYSVCNDEVAWTGIMKNVVAFKFDAGFEILASLSNPNRILATLDSGKGSFSFNGKQFGTYEIPSVTVDSMAITDFMIIVHISPADKRQVIQLIEAYHMGKLVLDAEFQGTIRVPALFGYSTEIDVNNIVVDINAASDNAASDRSLCKCPTWNDDEIHSSAILSHLMKDDESPFL